VLERFGFTPTEDRVYQSLLSAGPSTGYIIARELGIARANVYHALESLVRRGAARKSATRPVRYAATGPAALVAELERSFRKDLGKLEDVLQSIPIAGSGAAAELELLTSADQLVARAASCVDAASAELFAVTGPWGERLHARLDAAERRRVQVKVVALGEPAPPGALVRPVPEPDLRAYWGGLPLAVVADRSQAVFGILGVDAASGVATRAPGAVPFLRHLLRREHGGS